MNKFKIALAFLSVTQAIGDFARGGKGGRDRPLLPLADEDDVECQHHHIDHDRARVAQRLFVDGVSQRSTSAGLNDPLPQAFKLES